MKVKNVKIGISSTQETLDEAKKVMEAIERGEFPKKKVRIYFEDIHSLESILTEKRLTLLKTIKEREPKSIYRLAQILKRDTKNVSNDVNKLSELGFITLSKSNEGREKVAPTVDYDKILLEIPISDSKVKRHYKRSQG